MDAILKIFITTLIPYSLSFLRVFYHLQKAVIYSDGRRFNQRFRARIIPHSETYRNVPAWTSIIGNEVVAMKNIIPRMNAGMLNYPAILAHTNSYGIMWYYCVMRPYVRWYIGKQETWRTCFFNRGAFVLFMWIPQNSLLSENMACCEAEGYGE